MNTLVIIAVLVMLFALFAVGLIFFISKMMRQMKQGDTDGLRLVQSSLQQQMENLASRFETNVRSLDSKFVESNRDMQSHVRTQFSESQILIKDITDKVSEVREKVAEVREANKQVFTIAEQLQNLEIELLGRANDFYEDGLLFQLMMALEAARRKLTCEADVCYG